MIFFAEPEAAEAEAAVELGALTADAADPEEALLELPHPVRAAEHRAAIARMRETSFFFISNSSIILN